MSKPKKDISSEEKPLLDKEACKSQVLSRASFELTLTAGDASTVDLHVWELVLFNLLSRTAEFPCEGKIKVLVEETHDHLQVQIEDSGSGIPFDEIIQVVPKPGYLKSNHVAQGTGLGMSVISELLEYYDGKVEVNQNESKKSLFNLTLSKQDKHLAEDVIIESGKMNRGKEKHTDELVTAKKNERDDMSIRDLKRSMARILVVDDNPKMNDYISYMLSPYYSVLNACNGRKAYELALQERPDMIISDIMMPVMNGYDLVGLLKEHSELAQIPVILLSARAGSGSVRESIKRGADDYLIKPFSEMELLTRVKTHLELVRNRRLIKDQEARLEKSQIDQKDKFIGIASHELKTPLTSLLAYTELLSEKATTLDKLTLQSYLEKSSTFVKRLNRLVSELLDVSQIKKGKLKYEFIEFDFKQMIGECVESVKQLTTIHDFEIQDDFPEIVCGDRSRLQQVMYNLLSNAIKYSPDGGLITLNCKKEPEQIIVAVKDQGLGIPKEDVGKIFESYGRAQTEYQISGLGIGLFICSSIIERHGGKIWVESELDKGSVFYFTLPVKNFE